MVDVVGLTLPPGKDWWGWQKPVSTLWSERISSHTTPVIMHSCHVGCASPFYGPTMAVASCDATDPSQHFDLSMGAPGMLRDGNAGLCVGCMEGVSYCAGTALSQHNASGLGLGMQSCHLDSRMQAFNWSAADGAIVRLMDGGCLEALPPPHRQVVVQGTTQCDKSTSQQWKRVAVPNAAADGAVQIESVEFPGYCLSPGPHYQAPFDPWCASNNNMWRSNTDTLQVWGRVMQEVESLIGLGGVSGPGHWGFADSLEVGIPGEGVLTWEETKSHVALYAITSQPLFISNDVRPGYVQPRVLDLLMNKAMLAVDQAYTHGFAGDRLTSMAVGKEVWGKPLPEAAAAVLLFNRNGSASLCNVFTSVEAPCDDNVTEASAPQDVVLDFAVIPTAWLVTPVISAKDDGCGGDGASCNPAGRGQECCPGLNCLPFSASCGTGGIVAADGGGATMANAPRAISSCEVFDIFASAKEGKSLGRFSSRQFVAKNVPPHGSRFLRLNNCN